MPVDKSDIAPAVESTGDKTHRLVRSTLSTAPYVGGAAVELFNALIAPPLESRKQKWMEDVSDSISALEARQDFSIESIFDNEEFISTLIKASSEAIKNHEADKLEALRAAVLNSAIGEAPELSRRQMYLSYISDFTVWHLKILKFFRDPALWGQVHGIEYPNWMTAGRSSVLEHAFPELKTEREFYDQVWKDLHSRGLVGASSLHGNVSANSLLSPGTTASGKEFVDFIEYDDLVAGD